jgi:hypothetical protein
MTDEHLPMWAVLTLKEALDPDPLRHTKTLHVPRSKDEQPDEGDAGRALKGTKG